MQTTSKKNPLSNNLISFVGVFLAVAGFAVTATCIVIDFFSTTTNPYLGIFIYFIFPSVMVAGLILIPIGMWRERSRRRRNLVSRLPRFPQLDLNLRSHQIGLLIFVVGTIAVLILLSVVSYRGYQFGDSVVFCGTTCHVVMKPEYTAYLHSPHARVACVACHVGPGASWFVRSKLSGTYQIYSAAFHNYPRPVQSPVKNLRPAQETCEQCHWPAKFFGAQQKTFTHFLTDEKNSPWQIQMLVKVGGGDPSVGSAMGIHYHMNIANAIDYIATDKKRQTIPWVRATDRQGNVTEYMSTESPLTPDEMARAKIRRMDCVDCHNRPTHIFNAPNHALDQAFVTRRLDPSLPYLKRESILLLTKGYASEEEAHQTILNGLSEFYHKDYPDLAKDKALSIHQATEELLRIYDNNFFPYMRVDWRTHPDNLGHLNSEGCFRCHDGLHKSRDGKIVSKDCNSCHTILEQGPPEEVAQATPVAQPFRHPVDVGGDVTEEKCSLCHTGSSGL